MGQFERTIIRAAACLAAANAFWLLVDVGPNLLQFVASTCAVLIAFEVAERIRDRRAS
ncbi:hypothetical protein ACIBCB_18260 [Streptomyces uncialis]|uniref:hypothetical protein n=1 Tax=Streptomyces uncialis TaxID=1048205 RepID=UPI0037BC8B21